MTPETQSIARHRRYLTAACLALAAAFLLGLTAGFIRGRSMPRPARPQPTTPGQRREVVPVPLMGAAPEPVMTDAFWPTWVSAWAELRGSMLVVSSKGGVDYGLDLSAKEERDVSQWGFLMDVSQLPGELTKCYYSNDWGWVSARVCGAQPEWRIRLYDDRAGLIEVKRGGSLVFALLTGTGPAMPSLHDPLRRLFAIDAKLGQIRWVQPAGQADVARLLGAGAGAVAVGLEPPPTTGSSSRCVLLRASDGKRLRCLSVPRDDSWYDLAAALTDSDNRNWLAIADGSRLHAFDLDRSDGRTLWRSALPGEVSRLTARGGVFFAELASSDTMLAALEATTGKLLWSVPRAEDEWCWASGTSAQDGSAFFLTEPHDATRTIVRTDQGRVTWEAPVPASGGLSLAEGKVGEFLVAVSSGRVGEGLPDVIVILDVHTGEAIACNEIRSDFDHTVPFVYGDTLCLLVERGERPDPQQDPPMRVFLYSLSDFRAAPSGSAALKDADQGTTR